MFHVKQLWQIRPPAITQKSTFLAHKYRFFMSFYARVIHSKQHQNVCTQDRVPLSSPSSHSRSSRLCSAPVECLKRTGRHKIMTYFDQVSEAAAFLRSKLGSLRPRIGIVLGSGLGAVADAVTEPVVVPYAQIPHFPQSTVEGHSGRIVAGLLGGVPVIVMQGRVHFYEGYSPQQVTFPMRVLGALGLQAVVLTNAAGGIQEGYRVGQLVALSDHINFMGWNPLIGPNEPRFAVRPGAGLRFPDMTEAYSKRLRALAQEAAKEEGFCARRGRLSGRQRPQLRDPRRDSRLPRAGRNAGRHVHRAGDHRRPPHGNRGAGHLLRHQPGRRAGRNATESRGGRRDRPPGRAPARPAAPAARAQNRRPDRDTRDRSKTAVNQEAGRSARLPFPPVVLGIAGCSGSGKTTLTAELARTLGGIHFHIDTYYRDLAHLPLEERARQNFDHPSLIESPLLVAHLAALARGEAIERPLYDFATYTRVLGPNGIGLDGDRPPQRLSARRGHLRPPFHRTAALLQVAHLHRHARRTVLRTPAQTRHRASVAARPSWSATNMSPLSGPQAWPLCAPQPPTPTSPSTEPAPSTGRSSRLLSQMSRRGLLSFPD